MGLNPKKLLKKLIIKSYNVAQIIFSVKNNILFFESSVGRNYSGNPKYVYEELVRQGLDKEYVCIWSIEDLNTKIPGRNKKVKRGRIKYLYYLIRAKIWVCDTRQPAFLNKSSETTYIQLWHGTPLKKLALDMDMLTMSENLELSEYKRLFKENTLTWDYIISQSQYNTEKFKSCFDFEKPILEIGSPRNDVLINNNNEKTVNILKNKFNLPLDKKIILYAPTWRDDQYYSNGIYKFVSSLNFNKLKNELSDEYVLLVKFHYLIKDTVDTEEYEGFIYECDHTWDIQELYLISDMLITDYSSVMFDYPLLERPMLIFASDYENYKNNLRGFYFDLFDEFPGPISQTTEDLIREIKFYDFENYVDKYQSFLKKFTEYESGNASKQIVNLIQEKTKE